MDITKIKSLMKQFGMKMPEDIEAHTHNGKLVMITPVNDGTWAYAVHSAGNLIPDHSNSGFKSADDALAEGRKLAGRKAA